MPDVLRIAVVQATATPSDALTSANTAADLIRKAAASGARFIAFPEAFVGRIPHAIGDAGAAVSSSGPECAAFHVAASSAGALVGICVVEQEGDRWHSTGLLIDGSKGTVAKHRKLMPFGLCDTVWNEHSKSNLMLHQTAFGMVGAAIGAEGYSPSCREALLDQELSLCYLPGLDHNDTWLSTIKHMAIEGGCFVVSACRTASVVTPNGTSLLSTSSHDKDILYFDLDLTARRTFAETKRVVRANRPARAHAPATAPTRRPGPPQFHP